MISGYRLMWVLVMFDLPVVSRVQRRNYRRFVDALEDNGYMRVQFSIYVRPCATEENTTTHVNRIIDLLPPEGEIRVLRFTDKQWGRMLIYREQAGTAPEEPPEQFLFFDASGDVLADESGGDEIAHRVRIARVEAERKEAPTALEAFGKAVQKLNKVAERKRKFKTAKEPEPPPPSFDFFD